MKVRVLGCSGAIAQGCRTTSFLLDSNLLVDAGTGVGDLTLLEMAAIDHVLLTHSHLDHVAALPLMVDAVATRRSQPLQVHALPATIAALQNHIFNNVIWPDFSKIPSADVPFIEFNALNTGDVLTLAGKQVEVLPASHTVPAVGYAVAGQRGHWVFTGDTGPNPALWQRLGSMEVAMLVIETAFSNSECQLAERSQHLCPRTLAKELAGVAPGASYPIYITHTKPAETVGIMREILNNSPAFKTAAGHAIHWLQAGQEFDV